MLRRLLVTLGVLLMFAGVFGYAYLDRLLPGGAGFSAKHLCSLVHVSGLPLERAKAVYMDPFTEPFTPALSSREEPFAVVTRALWRSARAEYREGLGCTLRHFDDVPLDPPPERMRGVSQSRRAGAEQVAERFEPAALEAALDVAFSVPERRNTMAVLVQHRGEIVAERYADGITADTPLPGWSMTKSVIATMLGMLVRDGKVDMDEPGAIARWRGTDDKRAQISLDQLLRMTSGLLITEEQTGADPTSILLFVDPDSAGYSAGRPLQADPGTYWEYMSGSTVLATHRAQEVLGGGLENGVRYLDEELFAPLGMTTAVMEPDEVGTLVGSSFMLASAQDWAQLGQLYLNDGLWPAAQAGDGAEAEQRRILPEGWRDYVTDYTETSGTSGYGAGFWLTSVPGRDDWPGVPKDAFTMDGFQGQYVVTIPSEDLVIVRLGASTIGSKLPELIAGVVAAKREATDAEPAGTESAQDELEEIAA